VHSLTPTPAPVNRERRSSVHASLSPAAAEAVEAFAKLVLAVESSDFREARTATKELRRLRFGVTLLAPSREGGGRP
jgi:hypothetical protein